MQDLHGVVQIWSGLVAIEVAFHVRQMCDALFFRCGTFFQRSTHNSHMEGICLSVKWIIG